jgi:4-carboxymuconolactone decarboxylase
MSDGRLKRGDQVRREVLGDAHVDAAEAGTTDFTRPFQAYLIGAAWADVWARPGLDRRTRSAITLAVLTALHAEGEIPMHVRAALRNGLTREEIAEVLLHAGVYAGLPAANAAFSLAEAVISDEDPG